MNHVAIDVRKLHRIKVESYRYKGVTCDKKEKMV